MKKVTHRLADTFRAGKLSPVYTLHAKCGYFETFDLTHEKQHDTGFLQTDDFTCEECRAVVGLDLLGKLP